MYTCRCISLSLSLYIYIYFYTYTRQHYEQQQDSNISNNDLNNKTYIQSTNISNKNTRIIPIIVIIAVVAIMIIINRIIMIIVASSINTDTNSSNKRDDIKSNLLLPLLHAGNHHSSHNEHNHNTATAIICELHVAAALPLTSRCSDILFRSSGGADKGAEGTSSFKQLIVSEGDEPKLVPTFSWTRQQKTASEHGVSLKWAGLADSGLLAAFVQESHVEARWCIHAALFFLFLFIHVSMYYA